MTWQSALVIVLVVVDISALGVGLTVLRRVTRLVVDAGEQIHASVLESVEQAKSDAVRGVAEAVGPIVANLVTQVPSAIEAMTREVTTAVSIELRRSHDNPAHD